MKKFVKTASIITAAAIMLCGCVSGANKKLAMKIGDEEITSGEIKFLAYYGMNSKSAKQAAQVIEQNYIIDEIADKEDIELTDEEEKQIRSALASFKSDMGGRTVANKLMKEYGIEDDFLKGVFAASVYAEKVVGTLTVSDPTDEEIKQYASENYLRAKHVLIATADSATGEDFDDEKLEEAKKTADEVLEKTKNGEDFDALIAEYGEDPGMSSNPDGYFFGENEMVSEFEDATRSIEPGEITMCKSDYGYHIILRLPIDTESEAFKKFYEDSSSAIKNNAVKDKKLAELRKKAEELGIEMTVKQDIIDSISFEDLD